jgi:hypothetical protein
VLAFYRRQTVHPNGILASTSLDSHPAGATPPHIANKIHTVRDVILHMDHDPDELARLVRLLHTRPAGHPGWVLFTARARTVGG